ncbi:MAG: hypothetical protein WD749_11705 [Phycisphaerales bacterium]
MLLLGLVLAGDAAAGALAQGVEGVTREAPVVRECRHAEVDGLPALRPHGVGVAPVDQPPDHAGHAGGPRGVADVLGGAGHQRAVLLRIERDLEPQRPGIFEEPHLVEAGDRPRVPRVHLDTRRQLPGLLVLQDPPAGDGHAVLAPLAALGVVGHVADVGDVHDVDDAAGPGHGLPVRPLHLAEWRLQPPAEQVGGEEGAEVADVRIVVHRGPA